MMLFALGFPFSGRTRQPHNSVSKRQWRSSPTTASGSTTAWSSRQKSARTNKTLPRNSREISNESFFTKVYKAVSTQVLSLLLPHLCRLPAGHFPGVLQVQGPGHALHEADEVLCPHHVLRLPSHCYQPDHVPEGPLSDPLPNIRWINEFHELTGALSSNWLFWFSAFAQQYFFLAAFSFMTAMGVELVLQLT